MGDTILDVLARDVAARGGHPFILHEDRRVTYAELDRLASGAAHALAALGVEAGERVTLALGNSVEYLVAAFGILKAGAVLNPQVRPLCCPVMGIRSRASPDTQAR